MKKKQVIRILKRSYYYFNHGFSIVHKPLSIISFATIIYTLIIERFSFLINIFPKFQTFLMFGFTTIIPTCILIGYLYIKKSWFFRETFEIGREVNPYASEKIRPITIPIYEGWIWLLKKQGYDTTELERIVEVSR